jgi:uncharacterized protein YggE
MADSPRVVVRGQAVVEVAPDTADLVVTVQVRERHRDRAVALLAERRQEIPRLLEENLQPAPQEVRGQVEVTSTMSEPDEEVVQR